MKFVSKGWGWERWIHNDEMYCGKQLFFAKNKACSLHYHIRKTETFFVHNGRVRLFYFKWPFNFEVPPLNIHDFLNSSLLSRLNYTTLYNGDKFELVPYTVHCVLALEDSLIYEFSTQHFDEDSYRIIKGD